MPFAFRIIATNKLPSYLKLFHYLRIILSIFELHIWYLYSWQICIISCFYLATSFHLSIWSGCFPSRVRTICECCPGCISPSFFHYPSLIFPPFIWFSLANIHIKSNTSIQQGLLSAKNEDFLALFHTFSAYIQWFGNKNSRRSKI